MRSVTAKDIMSHPVHVLMADETFELAEAMMKTDAVRHLPVLDQNRVIGVVTHTDLLKASIEGIWKKEGLPARELMTRNVPTVSPDDSALDAALLLRAHDHPGCVLVVSSQQLVGIITSVNFLDLAIRSLDTGV